MKKLTVIVGLILLLGILAAGCAGNRRAGVNDDAATATPTVKATADATDAAPGSNVSAVSQADLDKLRAEIEKLEAEDLGGLTSE